MGYEANVTISEDRLDTVFNSFNIFLMQPLGLDLTFLRSLHPYSWLTQKYASLTVFLIPPGFAIQTEGMRAFGVTTVHRTSRPNHGSTFVAVPASFARQAVRALSRTIRCLFGGREGISDCLVTMLTLLVTVSMIATTELVTPNLVSAALEILSDPAASHGERRTWE